MGRKFIKGLGAKRETHHRMFPSVAEEEVGDLDRKVERCRTFGGCSWWRLAARCCREMLHRSGFAFVVVDA